MKTIFTAFLICYFSLLFAQFKDKGVLLPDYNPSIEHVHGVEKNSPDYSDFFKEAYQAFPNIPKGILEGVAYTNTQIWHVPENIEPSCSGMPQGHGVMGLMANGKGVFRENLQLISGLTGYSQSSMKKDPRVSILAYAKAFSITLNKVPASANPLEQWSTVLTELSELPINSNAQNYPISSFKYCVFDFINDPANQATYGFQQPELDLQGYFGLNNYKILSSKFVNLNSSSITAGNSTWDEPSSKGMMCVEVPGAIWNAAHSSNYGYGRSSSIQNFVIHKIQGSYAGGISWFKDPVSNVSTPYIIRFDGQITQMVCESNTGWHVGSHNSYTIGIEHDGYIQNNNNTTALYQAGALVVKDGAAEYGISLLRAWGYQGCTGGASSCGLGSCTKIRGHQHYSSQSHSDPGIYWDWRYFYKLLNSATPVTTLNAASGTIYDNGGSGGNYGDDVRTIQTIAPTNASSVTLTVNSFNTEQGWDYLLVYDGSTVFSPLIGQYSGTTIPGSFTATGSAITVEFRSDCATTNPGYSISWGSVGADNTPPTTTVSIGGNWQTNDFSANFTDNDNSGGSGVAYRFMHVLQYDGGEWRANPSRGNLKDNFDSAIHSDWSSHSGNWAVSAGFLTQSDEANGNSIFSAPTNQNLYNQYLYTWRASIGGSGTNRRAGLHFMCSDASATNRGNSYFVYFRADNNKLQIYSVDNNTYTLQQDIPLTVNANQYYNHSIVYDEATGKIIVFRDGSKVGEWTDSTPLTGGSYVSFRTGNCTYSVDNFNVYYRRTGSSKTVKIGTASDDDIQYQNANPTSPAGKVKSLVLDGAGNFSSIAETFVNVDWTAPILTTIKDGTGSDIDVTTSVTTLSGNWPGSKDDHSDIDYYEYAIGTSSGSTDILGWTNSGATASFTNTNLNLTSGVTYYVSVRGTNKAGLTSAVSTSDGIMVTRDVLISPQVILSGPYNSTSGIMSDNLRSTGLIPLSQPYNTAPFNYNGTETVTQNVLNFTGSSAIVDWVLVELRDKNDPTSILQTRAALIQADGDVVDTDGTSPVEISGLSNDNYFICIKHRNHLAVITNSTFNLNSNATTFVDFRTIITYGTNAQKSLGVFNGMWSGDADSDLTISASDRSLIWNNRNLTGYLNSDVDMDGTVNATDRSMGWNHRNRTTQLP